jgi:hypothetical protein
MLLLYILDQSVDLFLLKLFVNCLYKMNVVTCCVYSLDNSNVCIRLYFFDINVTDGVFFYIIFIMNFLFIIEI